MSADVEKEEREAAARELVLSLVLGLAGDVIDKAETTGLTSARLDEEVPALGANWKVTASYYRQTSAVQITAIAEVIEEATQPVEVEGVMVFDASLLRALFGQGPQSEANFQFVVPVSWVKLARGSVDGAGA